MKNNLAQKENPDSICCQGFIIYCYAGLNLSVYGVIHKLQGR